MDKCLFSTIASLIKAVLTIGSVAIALAFGFGGKDAAKTIADSWSARVIKK